MNINLHETIKTVNILNFSITIIFQYHKKPGKYCTRLNEGFNYDCNYILKIKNNNLE